MTLSRRSCLALGPLIAAPALARSGVIRVGAGASLGEALAKAPPGATILLAPGRYDEKLTVTTPGLTIAGAGPASVISYGAASGTARADGTTWGTTGSASLTIAAPGVTLRRLTVRNSFDYLANRTSHAIADAQAVALAFTRAAARGRAIDCAIEGYQDTLLVQSSAQFERCRISGSTDFIFGGGSSLFERCALVSRSVPGANPQGYVAAPSTPASQRFGLVFRGCRLEREAGVPDGTVWLGRPWRAGGDMSLIGQAAFLDCWMDAHVAPGGWTAMGYKGPNGTRPMLTPQDARLYEWHSRGPGAGAAGPDRRLLSDADAAAYTPAAILGA